MYMNYSYVYELFDLIKGCEREGSLGGQDAAKRMPGRCLALPFEGGYREHSNRKRGRPFGTASDQMTAIPSPTWSAFISR